ncbi:MAG: LptE family protein [Bacteroidales bacterium]|nr:LptE family protein [Bacteroidales bacterium]MDT8373485.1 LptE family protein [Bacteroidales bacterium]
MTLTIKTVRILLPLALLMVTVSCGIKVTYSFTGASIPPEAKTISVAPFQNRASLVQPGLNQVLTDALIDQCRAQTNLDMVSAGGELSFEGDITDYKTQPLTVSGNEQAASNRFSITVRVRYVNSFDQELSYDQSFTRYQDYNSALDLSAVEASLTEEIVKMLVEDIFNRAFVNW